MRVRKFVADRKVQIKTTDWRTEDIQPRHAPCFTKTHPIRGGWEWKSATLKSEDGSKEYVLLCKCHIQKDDWKSVLILKNADGSSVVSRFEFHGDHPGLHVHANCENGGILNGPTGMSESSRIPNGDKFTRRKNAWTKITFWEASKRFFRVLPVVNEQGMLDL